jgi:DNA-binding NtrC family response regulator
VHKKVLIVEDQFVEANDLQNMLERAGYEVCGIARSVEIAEEMIKKENPGLVLLDIYLKGKRTGIDFARELKKDNIAFIFLSANSNEEILSAAKTTEPYGFIVKPFREKDLLVTLEIAEYRHEHGHESSHRREAELIRQLEKATLPGKDWKMKLLQTAKILQQEIPFDLLSVTVEEDGALTDDPISFLRISFDEYQMLGANELSTITGIALSTVKKILSVNDRQNFAGFFNEEEFEKSAQVSSLVKIFRESFHVKSLLSFPLPSKTGKIFNFRFYNRKAEIYNTEHIALMFRLQPHLIKNIESDTLLHNKSISKGEPPIAGNNSPSKPPVFEGIIGNCYLLLNVLDLISQVAPFDTSVLLLGETGTGKERIADCIHKLSSRKDKPFVKINCAALPATLIESELFGHEKGSFTGATEKRTGKFERADQGTIFLDEIGEMPLDLQVKLLRVLQEKEIEPIGGKSPVKINVRVIAATNRNLEKEVAEGRFRLDLYYRLNVFPVTLPALREREEDIPALIHYFITIYNRKSGKKITGVTDKVMKKLLAYSWPGNIRELDHVIERSVLLAKGSVIEEILLPSAPPVTTVAGIPGSQSKTIHENERDHIIDVLKKCNGKIWGPGGAAEVLNVPPSTLKSKMKKLQIYKND